MKLHEAIEEILKRSGKAMTTSEIAAELNRTKLYTRDDGGPIPASQVGARVKNYPQWFEKSGKYISNKKFSPSSGAAAKVVSKQLLRKPLNQIKTKDHKLTSKILLNEKNFRSASEIDSTAPNEPGIYAIRIRNVEVLPMMFAVELQQRKHNLIYIGIASKSLRKRLAQELRAKGHGTFFRSLGALLGYLPPPGCLAKMSNKRNYTFSAADEFKVIKWINDNLLVNWVAIDEGLEELESKLIPQHKPLMNIAKNPYAMAELRALRARCVEVANSN